MKQRNWGHAALIIFPAQNEASWCMFLMVGAVKKEVYFMAIIDILTHYDAKKKAAHAAKTVKHGVSVKPTTVHHTIVTTFKTLI